MEEVVLNKMGYYNGFKCRGCNKEGLGIKDVNFKNAWAWCKTCLSDEEYYKEFGEVEKSWNKEKTLGAY